MVLKHSNPQRRMRMRKLVRMLRRTEDVGEDGGH